MTTAKLSALKQQRNEQAKSSALWEFIPQGKEVVNWKSYSYC